MLWWVVRPRWTILFLLHHFFLPKSCCVFLSQFLKKSSWSNSTWLMPSCIQTTERFSEVLSFFVPNSVFHRLWKYSFIFFEFKQFGRQLWASLNCVPRRDLLTLFQSSYKIFKGRFIKVCASIGDSSLLDGFPLYWSPNPYYQSSRRLEDLSPRERGICKFLEDLKVVFRTSTLLTK